MNPTTPTLTIQQHQTMEAVTQRRYGTPDVLEYGTGGEGTGRNPTHRGKLGGKWSPLADRDGIPIGWATDGANRHDVILFEPTLAAASEHGLVGDIETLHLDRGYDNGRIRDYVARFGIDDLICAKTREPGTATSSRLCPSGCDGRSGAPTRGCRTTDSSAATLTGASTIDSPNSPSPSPC